MSRLENPRSHGLAGKKFGTCRPAFQPGGWLYSKELDVQEVTVRCPGFYRASNGGVGEATGRRVKMHRRRGHTRTYHRGLPNTFTGYIDPVWINAIAGVVPPPVVYTVRAPMPLRGAGA